MVRIAVASSDPGRLRGRVAETLARAPYYTFIDIEECRVSSTRTVENPAGSFSHGAGPIVVKMLLDEGASILAGPIPGETVSILLREHGIRFVPASPGEKVESVLARILEELGCDR